MRAAPGCISTAAPPSIQPYLPNGDLNLNREPLPPYLSGNGLAGAQLLGWGKWQESLGLTPT
jgi:hypothetical protein